MTLEKVLNEKAITEKQNDISDHIIRIWSLEKAINKHESAAYKRHIFAEIKKYQELIEKLRKEIQEIRTAQR